MKKILALALAVVMVMAMSVTAFADSYIVEINNLTINSAEINVNGRYDSDGDGQPDDNDDNDDITEIIAVVIKWDSIEFTYTAPGNQMWNPDDLVYDEATTVGVWSDNRAEIHVENRSNVNITAKAEFTKDQGINFNFALKIEAALFMDENIVVDDETQALTIPSADNTDGEEGAPLAYTANWVVTVDQDTSAKTGVEFEDNDVLGTITVTVEQAPTND